MTQEPQPPPQSEPAAPPSPASGPAPEPSGPRPLLRSRQYRVLAGVCGGIATYLDIDPVLVRVAFVVLALFTQGFALIAYVVLWIVMPEDASAPSAPASNGSPAHGGGGALVLGVLLMAVGAVWLLETVATVRVDWGVVAAGALILVGLLVMVAGGGSRGGLITLGVLLLAVLLLSNTGMHARDMRFRGSFPGSGLGQRIERPRSVGELDPSYGHAFGSMTLDLRGIELPAGTTHVEASTAFGSAKVWLPPNVPVRVEASTAFGRIELLGEGVDGFGERTMQTDGYDAAPRRLELRVSTAFGSAEVRR